MKKITFPHRSRKQQIEYICGIGGYYDRGDRALPIEFDVSVYPIFDFDKMVEEYGSDFLPDDPELKSLYLDVGREQFAQHADRLWDWGIEGARYTLFSSDTFSYLNDGTEHGANFELYGRNGKHLCITKFSGRSFRGVSSSELKDMMQSEKWSKEEVNLLYRLVRHCEVWFSREAVESEVLYQATFELLSNYTMMAVSEETERRQEHAKIVAAAKEVFEATYEEMGQGLLDTDGGKGLQIAEAFGLLCHKAGLSSEEIYEISQHIVQYPPKAST